jgi:hypothetical protein
MDDDDDDDDMREKYTNMPKILGEAQNSRRHKG